MRLSGLLGMLGVGLSLLSAGCLGGDGGDGDTFRVEASGDCAPALGNCDIMSEACRNALFEATACVRQQRVTALPNVRTIDTETLREELQQMVGQGSDGPLPWDVALQLLGLIPEASTSVDASVEEFVTGVAAYYSHETREVTIIEEAVDAMDREIASFVLSHEFVHVLQDRAQGLQALDERYAVNTDVSTALGYVVEGEAVALSAIVSVLAAGADPARDADWDAFFDDMLDGVQNDVESSPMPFLTALQSLPYPVGGRVVMQRRGSGGQDAVERLYETGPGITADWLGPDPVAGRGTLAEPLECFPEGPPTDRAVHGLDSFGAGGLVGLLVAYGGDAATALELSGAMTADIVVVYGDADARSIAVEWRMQFVDEDAARDVLDALPGALGARAGRQVRLYQAETMALRSGLAARDGCGSPEAIQDAVATPDANALRMPRLPLD